jgi:CRISPR/Cas system CSM-associated protein Csm5 (group 7 of RAMP superfamily)
MTYPKTHLRGILRIRPITPIHIGSGYTFAPLEYYIDNGFFVVKDVEKYLRDCKDPSQAMKVIEENLQLGPEYVRYKIPLYQAKKGQVTQRHSSLPPQRGKIDPEIAKNIRQVEKNLRSARTQNIHEQKLEEGSVIRAFIKDPFDRPYFPASTLKGCLRTALAYALMCDADITPQDDPLATLVIRDSQALRFDQTTFALTQVSVRSAGIKDKQLRDKQTPLYTESVLPNIEVIEMPFYIDLFRLQRDENLKKAPAAKRLLKILQNPEEFSEALKCFSDALIEQEASFYTEYQEQTVANFLRERRRNSNSILLDVAFGTGWRAKTIGLALDPKLIDEVRKRVGGYNTPKPNTPNPNKNMGSPGVALFPKSRKLVATHKNGNFLPMGWFNLEICWL